MDSVLGWEDGQPYSNRYGDVYYSAASGLEETRHVFLQGNRLAERFALLSEGRSFCIAETGFGTGLNFLCAAQLFGQVAPAGTTLDFFSVEKFPLSDDELRATLAQWSELHAPAAVLLTRWRRRVPGWNRWRLAGGRVRLTLALCDVAEALPQLPASAVDAWFLDGFAPAKNPEMWSDAVLRSVARACRDGATLSSYTSAGWVRRGLQQAGFSVQRTPGFGRKREMVCGVLSRANGDSSQSSAPNKTPRTALVIGGGIAGCAAAHALAQRGVAITLIERALRLGTAASGNPRGMLHGRFGANPHPLPRLVLAAYGHALGLYDEVLPVDGVTRAECGLLDLAFCEKARVRIGRLAELEWPAHLLEIVDAARASQLAGIAMSHGGLWFPAGGWAHPPTLSANLANDERIAQCFGHVAETLERTAAGWRVSGHDTQGKAWTAEAEVVLVCCALSAKRFAQFSHFPLTPVRGQITAVPETAASRALQAVVCGDGYCAPAVDGVHVIGATHTFSDEPDDLRMTDNAENLARLTAYAPALRRALGDVNTEQLTGSASVRCSVPGAMPLVGMVQEGLYCSLAHGTRGLITAGLAGELLTAQICGELPPLPEAILSALAPVPRISR